MPLEITQLLSAAKGGDAAAIDRLYDRVYDELRRIARAKLRQLSGGTLHTTELVHEAYLKLFDREDLEFGDRAHFFALSARAMRQILVDTFRRRRAEKRGGDLRPLTLDAAEIPVEQRGDVVLAVDEALSRLSRLSERLGRVVECRFFGGMTEEEIAALLGVTARTVRSDWRKARAWLARDLASA